MKTNWYIWNIIPMKIKSSYKVVLWDGEGQFTFEIKELSKEEVKSLKKHIIVNDKKSDTKKREEILSLNKSGKYTSWQIWSKTLACNKPLYTYNVVYWDGHGQFTIKEEYSKAK